MVRHYGREELADDLACARGDDRMIRKYKPEENSPLPSIPI